MARVITRQFATTWRGGRWRNSLMALVLTAAIGVGSIGESYADPPTLPDGVPNGLWGEARASASQIGPSGAFTFALPISFPQGRGGLGPRLVVGYDSGTQRGAAGYGWTLSIPSIERSPLSGNPVFPQDVPASRHVFTEQFRYEGQPLVLVCERGALLATCPDTAQQAVDDFAPHFPEGGRYLHFRKHVDDTDVRLFLSQDRSTWKVLEKGGRLLTFGASEDARERDRSAAGNVVRWHLTGETDLRNPQPALRDRVKYRWTQSLGKRGRSYLTDIFYTPPAAGGDSTEEWAFHVELQWMDNPYERSAYGSPLRSTPDQLLKAVGIAAMPPHGISTRLVHRIYRLSYLLPRPAVGYDPNLHAPLFGTAFLHRFVEEGSCDRREINGHIPFEARDCSTLPPVTFEYERAYVTGGITPPSELVGNSTTVPPGLFNAVDSVAVVDFNRDGLPDLVQSWPSGPRCPVHDGTIWTDAQGNASIQMRGSDAVVVCTTERGGSYDVAYARPITGFLNEGRNAADQLTVLRAQCMDVGAPLAVIVGSGSRSPSFLTQHSANLFGFFGDSPLAWSVDAFAPYAARRIPDVAVEGYQGECATPVRPFGRYENDPSLGLQGMDPRPFRSYAFRPGWRWERSANGWAKPVSLSGPTYRWYSDVDGDGLVDALTAGTNVVGDVQLSNGVVMFTRRFATGEAVGSPVQIPFDLPGGTARTVVPNPVLGQPDKASRTMFFYVDVNGDGLVDLVTVDPSIASGMPLVRPGDGRGSFACDDGRQPWPCVAAAPTNYYPLVFPQGADGPASFDEETRFEDVTGDGRADLVKLAPSRSIAGATDVFLWVNLDGQHFACAGLNGDCSVGTLFNKNALSFDVGSRRVTFADMDANGLSDLVVVTTTGLYSMSFMKPLSDSRSAPRPGLLVSIDNGRGSSTRIDYSTVQALDLKSRNNPFGIEPWTHHAPVAATVVTRLKTEDIVVDDIGQMLPQPFAVERTVSFEYRDPAFDAWERRIMGFRTIRRKSSGEQAITQTTYWFGDCQNDSALTVNASEAGKRCLAGSLDEPNKGRVGRPVRIDRFIPGIHGEVSERYLWSQLITWTDDEKQIVLQGNRRQLHRPRVASTESWHYDANRPVIAGTWRPTPGGDSIQGPHQQDGARAVRAVFVYDQNGSLVWNERGELTSAGVVDRTVRVYSGSRLLLPRLPTAGAQSIPCDANFVCRPTNAMIWAVPGHDVDKARLLRATELHYDGAQAWAGPSEVRGGLLGTEPLLRRNPSGLGSSPGLPTDMPAALTYVPLRSLQYDAHGNIARVIEIRGPGGNSPEGCSDIQYDQEYAHFAQTVRRHVDGCGKTALVFTRTTDRGTGTTIQIQDVNGARRRVILDDFGRVTAFFGPSADNPAADVLKREVRYRVRSPVSAVEVRDILGDNDAIVTVTLHNGLGEPVMSFKGRPTDGHGWNVVGIERDRAGRTAMTRDPTRWNGDPYVFAQSPASLWTAVALGRKLEYDGFGRLVRQFRITPNTGPVQEQALEYSVFAARLRDGEQSSLSSPRAGAYVDFQLDHRGAVIETVRQPVQGSGIVDRFVRESTGELLRVERLQDGQVLYAREARFDSFGRRVAVVEPNTGETRLLYDRQGALIGWSDARGCGVDFSYDGLGRVLAENYSPCLAEQAAFSVEPEVEYRYDRYEPGQLSGSPSYHDRDNFALGHLVAVRDRGSYTRFNIDALGQVRRLRRSPAVPAELASRTEYAATSYATDSDFDMAGRLVRRTSGTTSSALLVQGHSEERRSYDGWGNIVAITSSYGDLLRSAEYGPDGNPAWLQYGDGAATRTDFSYDSERRLIGIHTGRQRNPRWDAPATPRYTLPGESTTQTTLQDIAILGLDRVGNPAEVRDRMAFAGQNFSFGNTPFSRRYRYDDFYRLLEAEYDYAAVAGVYNDYRWSDPLRAEGGAPGSSALPSAGAISRIQRESFSYDAIDNLVANEDDRSLRWDRSLGRIQYGGSARPHQLNSADNVEVRHDVAGNLLELKLTRLSCTRRAPAACSHWFVYDWDEVGQLARVRRWDVVGPLPGGWAVDGMAPSGSPVLDVRYGYSAGERLLEWQYKDGVLRNSTIKVLPTLQLASVQFDLNQIDYVAPEGTQRPQITGVAEVVHDPTLPSANGADVHMFLRLHDQLGSASVVIEAASGEVVERLSYLAYGVAEADTRSTRWNNYRAPGRFSDKPDDLGTGLLYFGVRYYSPHLRRWISADPLSIVSDVGDLNPYSYVRGRPTVLVDPDGLDPTPTPPYTRSCGPDCTLTIYGPGAVRARIEELTGRLEAEVTRLETLKIEQRNKQIADYREYQRRLADAWYYPLVAGLSFLGGGDPFSLPTEPPDPENSVAEGIIIPGPDLAAVEQSVARAALLLESVGGIARFRNLNPIVVLATAEDVALVARGPTRNLPLAARKNLLPNETLVQMKPDTGVARAMRIHPDMRVLVHAERTGLIPRALGVAGQPFCPLCIEGIEAFGGTVVSPWGAWFGGP